MIERERKFLVDTSKLLSSVNLSGCKSYYINQAYISTEDNEVRIRKKSYPDRYECFLTIKSDGFLERQEVENEIPYTMYAELIRNHMYKGNIIEKLRYEIPLGNRFIAELDVYDKELSGLFIVEVEFKDKIKDIKDFTVPDWFGIEVTEDKRFKNKNLALNGNPLK